MVQGQVSLKRGGGGGGLVLFIILLKKVIRNYLKINLKISHKLR